MNELYTDGACSGNPGPGGWAWVLVQNELVVQEKSGFELDTTNNRMELLAVIFGLKYLNNIGEREVLVYTDSIYVKQGITDWIKKWKLNGWKTANKSPVKNRELWEELDTLQSQFQIEWKWVKGHAHNQFNNRCDALAVQAYKQRT
ncbi:MAG: ribonuclease HI [Spirochaetaceae bacterium]|nr:ribonuclease HI [Spirochaetaceae bacterium]